MAKKKLSAAESRQRQTTAKTIRSVLRTRGINQTQMAEDIGCGRKSVERYSNCERTMPSGTRRRFIEAYGIDPELPFDPSGTAVKKKAKQSTQSTVVDERSNAHDAKARLMELRVTEPPVSSNNPYAIMCLSCGENEHIDNNLCRCGAPLAKQVRNQYSEWEISEKPLIRDGIKRLGRRSDGFWVLPIVSYLGFLGLSRWRVAQEFMATHFMITYGLTLIAVVGSGSIYFAMMRKRARLAKKEENLTFDDFIKSSHFKTLRRWD